MLYASELSTFHLGTHLSLVITLSQRYCYIPILQARKWQRSSGNLPQVRQLTGAEQDASPRPGTFHIAHMTEHTPLAYTTVLDVVYVPYHVIFVTSLCGRHLSPTPGEEWWGNVTGHAEGTQLTKGAGL